VLFPTVTEFSKLVISWGSNHRKFDTTFIWDTVYINSRAK